MAKFCGQCGTPAEENITVCSGCGAALEAAPVQAESQAAAPVAPVQEEAASPVATQAPPYQQQTPPYQQAPYQQAPPYQQNPYQQAPPYQQGQYQQGPVDPARDAYDNKLAGIFGYVLFFIPLMMAPNSKFAKYHANQGLILNILAVAIFVVELILKSIIKVPYYYWGAYIGTYTPGWVSWVFYIIWLGYAALAVVGILNASKMTYKQLPGIGKFTILK